MASLIWSAWPKITLEQSQTLYSHFAKQGPVVAFRSARKHLTGPSGQGIVVYKDVESMDKLLQGQDSVDLDLKHLFEGPTSQAKRTKLEDKETNDGQSASEDQDGFSWVVNIRNNHKSPSIVSTESMLAKRKTKITRISNMFETFAERGLERVPELKEAARSELKTILDEEFTKIREVERLRGLRKNKTEQVTATETAETPETPAPSIATTQESSDDGPLTSTSTPAAPEKSTREEPASSSSAPQT